jgi:hypothetical protein
MNNYNPYEIGRNLYRRGLGLSDTWGAVRCDDDVEACIQGYMDQHWEETRANQRSNS